MAKRRKVEEREELHKLLDLNPYDEGDKSKVDGDAIIKAARENQSSIETKFAFMSSYFHFPLFQAIMLSAQSDVIATLCSPAALKGRTGAGLNVLHVALQFRSSLTVVKMLIEKRQELVLEKDDYNNTSLHMACYNKAPLEVISLLVQRWPDSLQQQNNDELTPLHMACAKMALLEVVSLLVDAWPDGLQQKSNHGYTPLHVACRSKASLEVVSLLVRGWPDCVQQKNDNGYTPLHMACYSQAPLNVVSLFVQRWPGGLQEKAYDSGNTPLHMACAGDAPVEILSQLIGAWPDCLQEKNHDGDTPLHIACSEKAPFDIIFLLLDQWPDATIQRNNHYNTPFYLIKRNIAAPENSKKLLSHVTAMACDEMDHHSPHEIIAFFVELSWWKGVRLALDRYPLVIKTMNLPIHVMADFLSTVGRHCRLNTLWKIVRNEQDLLAGV